MRVNISSDLSRYDQKLELILRASAQIFAEKSYHSTSMRDISRATGVSLAGLYHYCKSKEELLFLIQDHCFGRVLERFEERMQGIEDPFEKLRIFIDNHLSFFAANMAEMKVLSQRNLATIHFSSTCKGTSLYPAGICRRMPRPSWVQVRPTSWAVAGTAKQHAKADARNTGRTLAMDDLTSGCEPGS